VASVILSEAKDLWRSKGLRDKGPEGLRDKGPEGLRDKGTKGKDDALSSP